MALSAPFASWVIREGGLPEVKVLAAVARQVVYGGGLDTALLECEVLSVEELWALLSRATGLAIPPVALLAKRDWQAVPLSSEISQDCRAVPAAEREDGVLQLLCAEPVELAALHEHATKLERTFELFIVPEVHLEALRSALYGRPMPARLAKLWVRLVGRSGLRTRPAPRPAPTAAALGALPGVFGDVDAPLDAVAAPRGRAEPREEPESHPPARKTLRWPALPMDPAAAVGTTTPHVEEHSDATTGEEVGGSAIQERREPRRDQEDEASRADRDRASRADRDQAGRADRVGAFGEGTTPLEAVMGGPDASHPAWSDSAGEEERDHDNPADPDVPVSQIAAAPRSTRERVAEESGGDSPLSSLEAPFALAETETEAQIEDEPEAPFALTLDFEAEPPLSDEPSLADEARASAMAWETFSATEALCRRARDAHDPGRMLALRALRRRLNMPPVPSFRRHLVNLLDSEAPGEPMRALSDLTEMRDREAVPAIVPLLDASDRKLAAAARQALMLLTLQDFGQRQRKWQSWWEGNRHTPPTDWLFEGLSHREAPIRLAAAEELRQITGAYFGYHFDLPKQDREDAKRRWQAWWWAMTEHEREEAEG